MYGEFRTTPVEYVAAVRRYAEEIGNLAWAAPQDHMCEPFVLAKSLIAHSVAEAQEWTVRSVLTLRELAPEVHFIPVLQGLTVGDYRRHVDLYSRAGVDLPGEDVVGLGSVCRRQATAEIAALVGALSADGLALHGFGVKTDGLRRYGWCLRSADSMAWSYAGRRSRPCPEGDRRQACGECLHFALDWRERAITDAREPVQLALEW